MNRTVAAAVLAVPLALVSTALGAGPAASAPPTDGCPSGYTPVSVAELWDLGYRVPAQMDSPTSGFTSFGLVGNDDGTVCARQMGNQVSGTGGPLYNFMDNQLPVGGKG